MNLSSLFEKNRPALTLYGPRSITALGLLLLIFSPGFGIMAVLTGFAWGYAQHAAKSYPKDEMTYVTISFVLSLFIFIALIYLTLRALATNPETSENSLSILRVLL